MMNEWVKIVCYICTIEYYAAVRKDEIKQFPEKWAIGIERYHSKQNKSERKQIPDFTHLWSKERLYKRLDKSFALRSKTNWNTQQMIN